MFEYNLKNALFAMCKLFLMNRYNFSSYSDSNSFYKININV